MLAGLKVLAMGESSFLFRFVTEEEALRVLGDGTIWMGENYLLFFNFRQEEETSVVNVVGLLAHF